MSKETGGFAFPQAGATDGDGDIFESNRLGGAGMTLRDYLAARAMASVPLALDDGEQKLIANAAYRQADAMLEVRGSKS